jgi:hypothetical protein
MGRQTARLMYKGEDHKNLYFPAKLEEHNNDVLMMHHELYKGSKLIWKKLPPNFMLIGKTGDSNAQYVYESVTGDKFDNLGYIHGNFGACHLYKVGNTLFSDGNNKILYSENWFSWKVLDSNLYNGEGIVSIGTHNEKLLIYTKKHIFLYDLNSNTSNIIHTFDVESYLTNALNICHCVEKNGTTVVVHAYRSDGQKIQLITIQDSKVVKTTGGNDNGNSAYSLAANENYFIFCGSVYLLNSSSDYDTASYVYISSDGITWKKKGTNNYLVAHMSNKLIFFKKKFYSIDHRKAKFVVSISEDGSNIELIDCNIDLTDDSSSVTRNFCIATDDYIYYAKYDNDTDKWSLIRFDNFQSDSYETLIDDAQISTGIYFDYDKEIANNT